MNRKVILMIGAVLLGAIVTGTGFFLYQNQTQKSDTSLPPAQEVVVVKPKTPSKTTKTYEDESGFSFAYPDNVDLKTQEITDESTYADITLTAKDVTGSIRISLTDTKLKTSADYFKSLALTDAKIGDLSGKQRKDADSMSIAAIDQGVLFLIDATLEKDESYWTQVLPIITQSFVFQKQAAPASSGSSGSSSDIIFEGEEVVE